jgi:hypothetical protein
MIPPMIEKFNRYWDPMKELAAIGLILDPQYKMCYLRYDLEQQSISAEQVAKFLGKVQSSFLDLWKMYAPSPAANVNPVNPLASVSKKVDQDTSAFHQYIAGTMGGTQHNAPGAKLDLYLKERNMMLNDDSDFDLLGWWKPNSSQFPSLSDFAKIILMIPMTSVASKSAFSTGGRVLDDYQTRLNEESVEALLCTQDWLRNS